MKIIVALTLLLVLINPSIAAVEEAGTGVDSSSNQPILYCVSSSEEAGSGTTSVEEGGSGISSSEETENAINCVVIY